MNVQAQLFPTEVARPTFDDGFDATPQRRRLPLDPNSVGALVLLANRRRAWNEAHPHATDDEQIDAWAEIAEELGL